MSISVEICSVHVSEKVKWELSCVYMCVQMQVHICKCVSRLEDYLKYLPRL